ncbi:MAG: hypothetical protein LBC87_12125 [Fibromonadaceae bacterium]|jgi:hypothetical protein|nr:hypothetical protein [Fibromonadaceae bacterium]
MKKLAILLLMVFTIANAEATKQPPKNSDIDSLKEIIKALEMGQNAIKSSLDSLNGKLYNDDTKRIEDSPAAANDSNDLETIAKIAGVIGVIIALLTFLRGIYEYGKQGCQKRAELFNTMRIKFKEKYIFKKIGDLLDTDDEELKDIPFADKRDFLGFFEEIALMMNSGLISKEVANYMFGYYAIKCWKSNNFWIGIEGSSPYRIDRNSPYWRLFVEFTITMNKMKDALYKMLNEPSEEIFNKRPEEIFNGTYKLQLEASKYSFNIDRFAKLKKVFSKIKTD